MGGNELKKENDLCILYLACRLVTLRREECKLRSLSVITSIQALKFRGGGGKLAHNNRILLNAVTGDEMR